MESFSRQTGHQGLISPLNHTSEQKPTNSVQAAEPAAAVSRQECPEETKPGFVPTSQPLRLTTESIFILSIYHHITKKSKLDVLLQQIYLHLQLHFQLGLPSISIHLQILSSDTDWQMICFQFTFLFCCYLLEGESCTVSWIFG